jgi:hypothetical protein
MPGTPDPDVAGSGRDDGLVPALAKVTPPMAMAAPSTSTSVGHDTQALSARSTAAEQDRTRTLGSENAAAEIDLAIARWEGEGGHLSGGTASSIAAQENSR